VLIKIAVQFSSGIPTSMGLVQMGNDALQERMHAERVGMEMRMGMAQLAGKYNLILKLYL